MFKVIFPVLREMEKSVIMNLGYIGVVCILQWGPKGTNYCLWVDRLETDMHVSSKES